MPAYFDEYFWTHGCGRHKGVNYNSMSPGHNDKTTMDINMGRSSYGCTQCRCGTVPKVATNNNINILLKYPDSNLVPPNLMSYNNPIWSKYCKTIIPKSDTGATGNYIRGRDTIILKNPGPTTTVPRFCLLKNSIIQPTLSVHLPLLMLPPTATQSHTYTNLKSARLSSIRQLCDSNYSAFFTKKGVTISNSEKTLYSME